ncbi:mitogen-activated protein kinase kinase kinase 20-like [Diospyros lotus]|uniref:mitogen-activated protein kinase kinase kinase 20-like n=1 Tax=Diospyros lotus TaxID=55363 RepID=UPI002258F6CF|nr:mitogen-activated protein kinase kinase kinase 20-like [Diospyros lotus]
MKRKRGESGDEVEPARFSKHGEGGLAWSRGALIGKGSFGSVYLANSKKPRSRYGFYPVVMAVKSAEVSASGSIQKEREVLNNIGRCPYIIRCFGEEITTGSHGEMVYNLLMEYGSGGTLDGLIKKSGVSGLPESDVRYYARSILRGLNHIHACGYVHRDLKPENMLLLPNSTGAGTEFRVKICDFGLAKKVKQNKKKKLDPYLRGTPMYLSPEAVADNIQEPPSDIWAFGCIVLEMLTGKSPWDGEKKLDSEALLRQIGEGNELPKLPSTLSIEGKEFLKGCFARKPMYRLTAEMLLNHSFVKGLADHDVEVEEGEKILVADEIVLSIMSYETGEESGYSEETDEESGYSYETGEESGYSDETEGESGYSSFSEDVSFDSEEESLVSSWSEEIDSQEFSSVTEEKVSKDQERGDATNSIVSPASAIDGAIKASSDQVSTNTMKPCPATFTIHAGI